MAFVLHKLNYLVTCILCNPMCNVFFLLDTRHGLNPWHRMGNLFEEWLCVNWAKVEQQRLTWHRNNQKVLRGDLYQGLQDAVSQGQQNTQPSITWFFLFLF